MFFRTLFSFCNPNSILTHPLLYRRHLFPIHWTHPATVIIFFFSTSSLSIRLVPPLSPPPPPPNSPHHHFLPFLSIATVVILPYLLVSSFPTFFPSIGLTPPPLPPLPPWTHPPTAITSFPSFLSLVKMIQFFFFNESEPLIQSNQNENNKLNIFKGKKSK